MRGRCGRFVFRARGRMCLKTTKWLSSEELLHLQFRLEDAASGGAGVSGAVIGTVPIHLPVWLLSLTTPGLTRRSRSNLGYTGWQTL
jgi:hypothetical protein